MNIPRLLLQKLSYLVEDPAPTQKSMAPFELIEIKPINIYQ
jgi:hypothetical protein